MYDIIAYIKHSQSATSKLNIFHLPASIQEQCTHMACSDQYSSLWSKKKP